MHCGGFGNPILPVLVLESIADRMVVLILGNNMCDHAVLQIPFGLCKCPRKLSIGVRYHSAQLTPSRLVHCLRTLTLFPTPPLSLFSHPLVDTLAVLKPSAGSVPSDSDNTRKP